MTTGTTVLLHDLDRDDPRWAQALPVLQELRPHLTADGLRTAYGEPGVHGARFLAAFAGDQCLGVAGWRIAVNTNHGLHVYVDDLVTTAARRSQGVGKRLLDELAQRAKQAGCTTLELDSGVQRHDAHRFYLRERLDISSHHFARRL